MLFLPQKPCKTLFLHISDSFLIKQMKETVQSEIKIM